MAGSPPNRPKRCPRRREPPSQTDHRRRSLRRGTPAGDHERTPPMFGKRLAASTSRPSPIAAPSSSQRQPHRRRHLVRWHRPSAVVARRRLRPRGLRRERRLRPATWPVSAAGSVSAAGGLRRLRRPAYDCEDHPYCEQPQIPHDQPLRLTLSIMGGKGAHHNLRSMLERGA